MDILERLQAQEEIRQLKARYFRLVDTKAWPEFRALFTDDATLHYPEAHPTPNPIEVAHPMIVASLRNATSVHHGHMPEIQVIDADNATGIWSMEDQVYMHGDAAKGTPPVTILGAGHYHETYRQVNGEWKIASLVLTRLRHETNQNVVRGVILPA